MNRIFFYFIMMDWCIVVMDKPYSDVVKYGPKQAEKFVNFAAGRSN